MVEAFAHLAAAAVQSPQAVADALANVARRFLGADDAVLQSHGIAGARDEPRSGLVAAARRPRLGGDRDAPTLAVRLVADDASVGVLLLRWSRPRRLTRLDRRLAAALGPACAAALRSAARLEEAQRGHAQLQALIDTAEVAMMLFDGAGGLRALNRRA